MQRAEATHGEADQAAPVGIDRKLRLERIPCLRKDRDRQLVGAEAESATFGLVGGLEELGFHRGRDVLGRTHLGDATLDPLGDAAAFDRGVGMSDDRVLRGPKCIEHAGPGRGGVGFDIEDGGEPGRRSAFLDFDDALAEVYRGTGGVFRKEAPGAARVGAEFSRQER